MTKNMAYVALKRTVVFTTLFVLTLGAVLISLVVGDWIMIHTKNEPMAWLVGSTVLIGFLATLGAGVGFWLWFIGSTTQAEVNDKHDTMDRLLRDMSVLERD